jgi:hypothetical protein
VLPIIAVYLDKPREFRDDLHTRLPSRRGFAAVESARTGGLRLLKSLKQG